MNDIRERFIKNAEEFDSILVEVLSEYTRLQQENSKLKSMCRAAADEIDTYWNASGLEGYGPANLISRLRGRLPPDHYPGNKE